MFSAQKELQQISSDEEKSQAVLLPTSWNKLEQAIRVASAEQGLSPQKIHCHIPVCAGHKGSITRHQLQALINAIIERNYDFTIYVEPREKLPGDTNDAYSEWREDNKELLASISADKVKEISEWRSTETWKKASTNYEEFRNSDKKITVKTLLDKDVTSWSTKHSESAREAIIKHIVNTVKDCVSWMVPKTDKFTTFNVLIYDHPLTELMWNAMQNAEALGYFNSLIRIKPKFQFRYNQEADLQQATSVIIDSPGLTAEEKDFFKSIAEGFAANLADKKADKKEEKEDTLFIAKVLFITFNECIKQKHMATSNPVPIPGNRLSENGEEVSQERTPRNSPVGRNGLTMFGGKQPAAPSPKGKGRVSPPTAAPRPPGFGSSLNS